MNVTQSTAGKRLVLACCALVLLGAAALGIFTLTGGRLHNISTPSMAQTAPVGTLVVVHPDTPHVGDIITFTPNNSTHSYTHRIVAAVDGGFQTRGDLNGAPDPWTVTPNQIEGVVHGIYPGVGYLLHASPILLFGFVFTWLLTRRVVPVLWRWPTRLVGFPLTLGLAAMAEQPWTGVQMLGYSPDPVHDGVTASVVSTGLLPIHVHAVGGNTVDLVSGQQGLVSTALRGVDDRFHFTPSLDLPVLGWVLLGLVCAAPAVISSVIVLRDWYRTRDASGMGRFGSRRGDRVFAGGAVVLPMLVVGVAFSMIVSSSSAGFVASVASGNGKGTRAFFTCKDSVLLPQTQRGGVVAPNSVIFSYLLNSLTTAESDYAGSSAGSTWTTRPTATAAGSPDAGCRRDLPVRGSSTTSACLDQNNATATTPPTTFSIEFWFKTAQKPSGRIIGFSNSRTTTAETVHDREFYLDADGRIVYHYGTSVLSTPFGKNYAIGTGTLPDGSGRGWNHVVVTETINPSGTGTITLYVNGSGIKAVNPGSVAYSTPGWWRIACSTGTTTVPGADDGDAAITLPNYFVGGLQDVTVYSNRLSDIQPSEHYRAGAPH